MSQISASVELPAPPEKVWALASNPNEFGNWLTLHVKWKGEVPDEFSQGAQVTEVVSMMGMPNTITWTVDEYQPPSTGDGPEGPGGQKGSEAGPEAPGGQKGSGGGPKGEGGGKGTVAISGTGMAGVKVAIEISVVPTGGGPEGQGGGKGSTFNLSTEFSGQLIVGALGKAIEKQGQKELETSLAKFKALLD